MSCKMCGCASLKKCNFCGQFSTTVTHRSEFDETLCTKCYDTMVYFENINRDILGRSPTHECVVKENVRPKKRKHVTRVLRRQAALYEPLYSDLPLAQSSDPIPVNTEDTSEEAQMNMTFKDNDLQKVLAYGVNFHDETFDNADQPKANLGGFLSRPVRIFEFRWEVNTTFPSFVISPWSLYLANPRIAEKIATYKLLNATLKIKLMLNGSPFHYGRVFVGMRPTQFTNNTFNALPEDNLPTINYTDGGIPFSWTSQKNFYSQRPHVQLNPAKNIPQEIHWPFFSSTDWIEVNNTADHARMGVLEFWELNRLQHANGATDPVVISVYAWMEDVILTGITDVVAQSSAPRKKKKRSPKKTDQQKNNVDEYDGKGVVSYPASVIEGIAAKLTDVPFIGKFAMATHIGAGAVKNIASLFGFSNPTILDKQCMITQHQFGRMCQTAGNDVVVKLSLDPKNELTIDPSTVGLSGDDEMSFSKIAQREALIHTFVWSTTTLSFQTHLWGARVWPKLGPIQEIASDPPVEGFRWYAPCGYIALPFDYWTGSLIFRFQVVCSAFHRGRLGIVYTPDVTGLTGALTDYNSVEHFNYIVDISQETDVSFEINWAQPSSWCSLIKADYDARDVVTGPDITMIRPGGARIDNGRLDVYVITDLGAPITDSEVEINVWMSAGDSFRVATPSDRLGVESYTFTGGEFDIPAAESAPPRPRIPVAQSDTAYQAQPNEDDPGQITAYVLNGDTPGADNSTMLSIYMGEDIRSIRAMIKRYCPCGIFAKLYDGIGNTNMAINACKQPNFPLGRAGGPYGSSGLDYGLAASDVFMTYLRYYAQAFIGYRGGVRWKALYVTSANQTYEIAVFRNSDFNQNQDISLNSFATGGLRTLQQAEWQDATSPTSYARGTAGIMVQPYINTNSISYELPYYHPTRFADIHCETSGTTNFDFNNGLWCSHSILTSTVIGSSTLQQAPAVRTFVAGAEDSSFFFFIGMPAIARLPNPLVPPAPIT